MNPHTHINNAAHLSTATFKKRYVMCLCPSPLLLVLIRSALCLVHRALCPAVIECVLAALPRNYSLPSRAIQHKSTLFNILTRWGGKKTKTCICSSRVYNNNRTRHSAPFTFKSLHIMQTRWAGCVEFAETWMSVQRKLPIGPNFVFLFAQLECDGLDRKAWVKGNAKASEIERLHSKRRHPTSGWNWGSLSWWLFSWLINSYFFL